jgi:TonB-dependent receptor
MKNPNLNRGAWMRATPVAAAVATLLCSTGPVMAQEATQTITVTGIRRGIESAITTKKNSDSIVEAISAEDIGKLPDTSIAESIARLPGLAAQRVAGRAQVVSVRGLSPDFATTLLNGRELVSTGDNRSVEFDQYPSELLSGVTIYKTPDAGLVGQGLSGTIDMQTVRPLNFGSRVFAVSGRYEQNSLGGIADAKASGNRFSVSYIDQFANRTVGIVLGFAHLETPILEHQTGLYEPWDTSGRPGLAAGTFQTGGIKALARSGKTTRDGFMGAIEWRPSKDWTSLLDVYSSKFSSHDTQHNFEVNLGNYNGGFAGLNWTGTTINGNNTLVGGTANNVYPLVRGLYNKRDDTINAFGWNNKFKLAGVSLNADVNWSKAKRDEVDLENNLQLGTAKSPGGEISAAPVLDNVRVAYPSGSFLTASGTQNYSNPTTLLIQNSIYGAGYAKAPHIEDELKGFKLVATLPAPSAASFLTDIDVGVNVANRDKKKRQPEGNQNMTVNGSAVPIASDLLQPSVDLGFAGAGTITAWDVPGASARYTTYVLDDKASYLIAKAWEVKEKITTAFVKAGIDTQVAGMNLRGNVGVQLQNVDQSSQANYYDGTAPAGSQVKPIDDGKKYTDVLPSLNLALALGGDQTLRFGMARQVARPRVDQLRASVDFGVNTATGRPGASGGNPNLDPWRADAVDISYEKYFGTKAYVAAAGFYKNLKSYIYDQSKDFDFSRFVAGYVPAEGNPAALTTGTFTAPYNGKGGKMSGLEFTASLPLNLLTPALSGFGVVASTSITNSDISIDLSKDLSGNVGSLGTLNIPLQGLSKNVTNLTVYYENAGFEVRISQRRRSDFIGEIGDFAAGRKLRYVVGENITDLQVGYTFSQGPAKGLNLLLQVNNIGDSPYQTYSGTRDRPLEYIKYGSAYLLGANYKF